VKVLLDECVDRRLARDLADHDVKTARQVGWTTIKNGELLALASNEFDVFVTVDRNLSFQQNIASFPIAVVPGVQLRPPDQAPKISRILRDDDAVFLDAPREHAVIRCTASADVQWVDGVVSPGAIEPDRELRGKALVDEKPHAASDQGLPPRRAISGCVRA
jgi:Domain of unknown function (DUF5615)